MRVVIADRGLRPIPDVGTSTPGVDEDNQLSQPMHFVGVVTPLKSDLQSGALVSPYGSSYLACSGGQGCTRSWDAEVASLQHRVGALSGRYISKSLFYERTFAFGELLGEGVRHLPRCLTCVFAGI